MRLTLPAVCVTLLLAPALRTEPAADRYAGRLDPFLQKTVREADVPGLAIGIVADGRLAYARGFGVLKVGEPERPVTPETLFHMASITKPFVATAVLQLMERGKVDLDAPVTTYVPYFRLKDPRYRSVTVRQMLTHTSGMPDVRDYGWDKPEYDDGSLERYVRSLGDKSLLREPGSKFAYSNMAYEVLGDLVAKVSGESFERYVEVNILKPLGMKSSTLLLKEADPAKLAAGHTKGKDGNVRVVAHYPYNRAHTPSSDLHSSVTDMARWAMANINRGELDGARILKASTYDLMWKPAARTGSPSSLGKRVGISWFLGERMGVPTVSHGGGDDGFRTYLVLAPDRKAGVVVMSNTDRVPLPKIVDAALEAALGGEGRTEPGK
jgi:CubicO group peptidase (beta-lactamase class C family)